MKQELLQRIMQDFKDRWKPMVSIIRQEVLQHFADSMTCKESMMLACLQLLQQRYKDFLGVLEMQGGDFKKVAREGPSLQTLEYELQEVVQ
jgi:hypothetical protein